MTKTIFAAALAALFVASCGHDDPPITRTEFCQSYAERECSNVAVACLMLESDCMAVRQTRCTAWGQNEEDAVPPRSFDPQNANACLSKVSAVFGAIKGGDVAIPARDYRSVDESCARVFHGNGQDQKDTCSVDADCSGSLICDKGYCGTSHQVGPGEGCANIGESCPQGYFCGGATVLTCTVRPDSGASCGAGIPCLEDLRCSNGACVERLAGGSDCQTDGDCASRFCEPFALKCGADIRFANGSAACQAYQFGS